MRRKSVPARAGFPGGVPGSGAVAAGVALAVALVLSACATTPQRGSVEYLHGCWYFEDPGAPSAPMLPWGVRLTDRPLEGWPAMERLEGVRQAVTMQPEAERDHPFGYWRPLAGGDSVEIGYPAGGGLVADLAASAGPDEDRDYLSGTVRPVGDVVTPGAAGTEREATGVRLIRARCPE